MRTEAIGKHVQSPQADEQPYGDQARPFDEQGNKVPEQEPPVPTIGVIPSSSLLTTGLLARCNTSNEESLVGKHDVLSM